MNIVPKEILLEIIKEIYADTPPLIKGEVVYIGITGSYLFGLEKEKSDYDVSVILNYRLEDEKIQHAIKRYFADRIRNKLVSLGYASGAVDVHTVRKLKWVDTNNTIATFCMKYQTEHETNLGVATDDYVKLQESLQYYFVNRSYQSIFEEYVTYNKAILSSLYYFDETVSTRFLRELYYHVFMMYNMAYHNELYTNNITRDDIADIKKLVKGKLNYYGPVASYSYTPMDKDEQERLFQLLKSKLVIILNENDLYTREYTQEFLNII